MSRSIRAGYIPGDSKTEISKCLSCSRDTCNNCLIYKQPTEYNLDRVNPPKGVDLDKFIGLYNAGLRTADLATALGTTTTAMKRFMVRSRLTESQNNRPLITRAYWKGDKT